MTAYSGVDESHKFNDELIASSTYLNINTGIVD